ncbi:nuclease-related domain-containing protein [Providencia huaxiensis]|uniref:nuclease-related domain-containing protein n=1 Tax=Providencia huaxiensis TaxID=2027290 RepID=UPI0034E3C9A6
MIEEFNKYDTVNLEFFFENNSQDEIRRVIEKTLTRPDLIIIRNIKNREKRDAFLEELLKFADGDLRDYVESKVRIILFSESIFDNLSRSLEVSDISKESEDIQVWSHIEYFEKSANELYEYYEKNVKFEGKTIKSGYVTIENNDININIDATLENHCQYLTMSLLLLAFKYKWFVGNKLIIPNKINISDRNLQDAEKTVAYAMGWKSLLNISERSILFGGDAYYYGAEDMPQTYRENDIHEAYAYEREETDYEVFDSIACERVREGAFQNFMEILSTPEIKDKIIKNFNYDERIGNDKFISEDELLTCHIINQTYCVDVFTDQDEYHGLTLFEWVRGYHSLSYISKEIKNGASGKILTETELTDKLYFLGMDNNKILIFLNLVSFSKNSSDIYDCPLIKMENECFYFSFYSMLNPNISNLIMSRLSSLESDTSDKGYRFEDKVNSYITDNLTDCKSFKFRRGGEEYEYDGVFILDTRIFLLECKNRSLSWGSPVKEYRNMNLLKNAVKQVIRLKNALEAYPEVIKEKFNVNVAEFEVVPVIFNCMPFSWQGKHGEVYISDRSSFYRLISSRNINLLVYHKDGVEKSNNFVFEQWKEESICSDDIINHFESPIQVLPFIKSRTFNRNMHSAGDNRIFRTKNFIFNTVEYEKEKTNSFQIRDKVN